MLRSAVLVLTIGLAAPGYAQPSGQRTDSPTTDQTVAVQKGMRLSVVDFAGEIAVRGWNRDEVRVQAEHSTRDRVDVRTREGQVTVSVRSTLGAVSSMNLRISVPAWMRLDLSGTYTDIVVDGVQGQINADTVRGDIRVNGGSEFVNLKSIEGVVTLEGAKGKVKINCVNKGITLVDVSGDVVAETINGALTMERMQASSLDAATINGAISYEGAIRNDGQYRMTSHNGSISMTVPDNTSATVAVRTFNGSFQPNFPVTPDDASRRNRRYNFTLGGGGARITLESFGGSIRMTKGSARR